MRIDRLQLGSEWSFGLSVAGFVFAKILKAAARPDGVNVPLGKNGA